MASFGGFTSTPITNAPDGLIRRYYTGPLKVHRLDLSSIWVRGSAIWPISGRLCCGQVSQRKVVRRHPPSARHEGTYSLSFAEYMCLDPTMSRAVFIGIVSPAVLRTEARKSDVFDCVIRARERLRSGHRRAQRQNPQQNSIITTTIYLNLCFLYTDCTPNPAGRSAAA